MRQCLSPVILIRTFILELLITLQDFSNLSSFKFRELEIIFFQEYQVNFIHFN